MLRQHRRRCPFEVPPTARLEPWGPVHTCTGAEDRVAAGVSQRFVFLRVIKGYCVCEGTLGHLELSVFFPNSNKCGLVFM